MPKIQFVHSQFTKGTTQVKMRVVVVIKLKARVEREIKNFDTETVTKDEEFRGRFAFCFELFINLDSSS